jgi:hypothetical protein
MQPVGDGLVVAAQVLSLVAADEIAGVRLKPTKRLRSLASAAHRRTPQDRVDGRRP